jgi:hypothetical protein
MGHSPKLIPPLTLDITSMIISKLPEAEVVINHINSLALDTNEAQDNLLIVKVAQAEFANDHCGDKVKFEVEDGVLHCYFL